MSKTHRQVSATYKARRQEFRAFIRSRVRKNGSIWQPIAAPLSMVKIMARRGELVPPGQTLPRGRVRDWPPMREYRLARCENCGSDLADDEISPPQLDLLKPTKCCRKRSMQ